MVLFGKEIKRLDSPLDALENGIIMVPEDRKTLGLVLELSVMKNIILPNTDIVSRFIKIDWKQSARIAERFVRQLNIKTPSIKQLVKNLSGGNQQKVVIAKYLVKKPRLAVFVEPTRGIDIGAHAEIIKLIRSLCDDGMSLLVASSELDELVAFSNKVVVMRDRYAVRELTGSDLTSQHVMQAIAEG